MRRLLRVRDAPEPDGDCRCLTRRAQWCALIASLPPGLGITHLRYPPTQRHRPTYVDDIRDAVPARIAEPSRLQPGYVIVEVQEVGGADRLNPTEQHRASVPLMRSSSAISVRIPLAISTSTFHGGSLEPDRVPLCGVLRAGRAMADMGKSRSSRGNIAADRAPSTTATGPPASQFNVKRMRSFLRGLGRK